MKYLALCLCGLSAIPFISGYAYAKTIVQNIPAYEFQGGHGFALNAPLWGYGIAGLVLGFGGFCALFIAIAINKSKWYTSPAILLAMLLLIPFFKACWVVLNMIVDTYFA